MMCRLELLKDGKRYSGLIIKEDDNYTFYTIFSNNKKGIDRLENNLNRLNAKIHQKIENKDKEEIGKIMKKLNKAPF